MARFDFVEAASYGYKYVWQERKAIVTISSLPLAVKIGSFAAISLFGLETNFLRQGLILMPAYFLEAFAVMLVIRMAMFGESFDYLYNEGMRARGKLPGPHARAILAGVAFYMLAKLVSSFLSGGVMMGQQLDKMQAVPEPQGGAGGMFVLMVMVMIFSIWAFRFFWLYVPAAMEISTTVFLERIKGFIISVYMVGLWVVCFVPMAVLLLGFAKLMMTILPASDGSVSPVYIILISVVQAVIELFVALASSVGMAYATKAIITGDNKPPRLF